MSSIKCYLGLYIPILGLIPPYNSFADLFLMKIVPFLGVALLSRKSETTKATDGKAQVAFLPGCLFGGEPQHHDNHDHIHRNHHQHINISIPISFVILIIQETDRNDHHHSFLFNRAESLNILTEFFISSIPHPNSLSQVSLP